MPLLIGNFDNYLGNYQTYELSQSFFKICHVLQKLIFFQVTSKDKKRDTEAFLGPLAEERFALLVNLCKKISDFGHDPSANKDEGIDETYGIPVQFDNYEVRMAKGGPQIGLSAVIASPRSPQSTYRVHTLTMESLLHGLHVIFGIFKIGGH